MEKKLLLAQSESAIVILEYHDDCWQKLSLLKWVYRAVGSVENETSLCCSPRPCAVHSLKC